MRPQKWSRLEDKAGLGRNANTQEPSSGGGDWRGAIWVAGSKLGSSREDTRKVAQGQRDP